MKHVRFIINALRHWQEFKLGWREAYSSSGVTYDDDPWSDRSLAYDYGRNIRTRGRA